MDSWERRAYLAESLATQRAACEAAGIVHGDVDTVAEALRQVCEDRRKDFFDSLLAQERLNAWADEMSGRFDNFYG